MTEPIIVTDSTISTVIIGAVVAIFSTMSPILLSWLTNRNRRQEQQENYNRQDVVAARLAARQDAMATKAADAAILLASNTEKVATSTALTNKKLDVIHTLVNSSMTAAIQAEMEATVRVLALLEEVISLNNAAGRAPSVESLAAVESTKKRIAELASSLADRSKTMP